jgi:predicted nuclease of predicted toxin-antitoxin system
LNFLVDAQLPPQLGRWIASRGHEATHVFDAGLLAATDAAVWQHAIDQQAIIVSKDEDFVDRWLVSDNPVTVIWVRKGNCSNRALLTWFEPLWPDVLKRLELGERLIELRG